MGDATDCGFGALSCVGSKRVLDVALIIPLAIMNVIYGVRNANQMQGDKRKKSVRFSLSASDSSEIGLVGRTPGIYNLYLGGAHEGTRLNKLHKRDVDGDGIVAALAPLFKAYATGRQDNERFGDFVIRTGIVQQTKTGLDFHENLSAELRN